MAGPADLIRTVSEATGMPLATVVDIDRKLVKAGLRSKGGRGLHAASMTALDAAHILTAILASSQANRSAETVARYREARVDPERSSEGLYAAASIGELAVLPARHSFVDGLATLIDSAATGSLAALAATAGETGLPHIEVYAFSRATYGRIRLSGLANRLTAHVEYRPADDRRGARLSAVSADGDGGDLETSSRITERTIFAIASLLAKESTDERK